MDIFKNLIFNAVFSGLLFGSWPLINKESGLNSYASATVYCFIVLCFVGGLTLINGVGDLSEVKWRYSLAAGLVGGVALASFAYAITHATKSEAGNFFLITLLCQMLSPTIYTIVVNWERDGFPSAKKTAGIIGVFVVAYLLG